MEDDIELKEEVFEVTWENYFKGKSEAPESEFSNYIGSCTDFEKIEKG